MPHHEVVLRRRDLNRLLFLAIATILSLDLFRIVLRYGFGRGGLTFFNVTYEGNLPTWFSSLLLAANALTLVVIAGSVKRHRPHWWILAAGFGYMSLDEAAHLHEALNDVARNIGFLTDRLRYPWVVLAVPFVIVVGGLFVPFLRGLRPDTRSRFIVAGALYVGGAVVLEVFFSAHAMQYGLNHVSSQLIRTVEEGMEMAGAAVFLSSLIRHFYYEFPPATIRVEETRL